MQKVTKPDIIHQRIESRTNLWNWVLRVNKKLSGDNIEPDNSIIVKIPDYQITSELLEQLIEVYSNEGWTITQDQTGGEYVLVFSAPVV